MLKKIKFKGGFFTEETELELFMHEDKHVETVVQLFRKTPNTYIDLNLY